MRKSFWRKRKKEQITPEMPQNSHYEAISARLGILQVLLYFTLFAFVILSFMIRTEVCTMLLPFLLLAGFGKWMAQKEPFSSDNIVRYLMLIGIAIFGMGMMYAIDVNAYEQAENSEEWEEFRSFFDARTDLYDFYGIPSYSDNYHFFEQIGLKRESYTLLENYNYSLDESIDAEMLEQLVEFQKRYAGTEPILTPADS